MAVAAAVMNTSQIETLVRNIIVHGGRPFELVSVADAPSGWTIVVRNWSGTSLSFTIHAGRPVSMRTAIQEHLESDG